MGLNEDSIGLANDLKRRNEAVYICDSIVKGLHKREDFTYIDEHFIHAMDPVLTKVFIYEPPYINSKLVKKERSFVMEKTTPVDEN